MQIEWKDRKAGDLLKDENGVLWFVANDPHPAISEWGYSYGGDQALGTLEVLYRRPDPEPPWPEAIRYSRGGGRSWVYHLNADAVAGPVHAYSAEDAREVAAGWGQVAVWLEWEASR